MNGWSNKSTAKFVSVVSSSRFLWAMVKDFVKNQPNFTGDMLADWAEDNLPDIEPYINSVFWSEIDWDQVAEEWNFFN
jgi:hypothetical protein